MTNKVWFTSDTHWGQKKVQQYIPARPGKNLEEHDQILIDNWNSVVSPGDTVYHLGDFVFGKYRDQEELGTKVMKQLNGQVQLIFGNHDSWLKKAAVAKRVGFAWTGDIKKIKPFDTPIILFHYAMRTWRGSCHGFWHLYGHSHGNLADDPNSLSCDVGVDVWDYKPVSYDQIVEIMKTKSFKPIDHHDTSNHNKDCQWVLDRGNSSCTCNKNG
jgi:calcineurin-like phosphoesterase family protein